METDGNRGTIPGKSSIKSPVKERADAEPFIRIQGIEKHYGGGRAVLSDISFHVRKGEWLAVAGKSGSGKTTLINLMAGLDTPDRGEIFVGGVAVHTLDEKERAVWRAGHVGFIFQFFHLLPTLTVLENVVLAMDLGDRIPVGRRMDRAREILASLQIAHLENRFPSALSGGEKQRTAIARALVNDPALLVADEPTGNLDTKTASTVFDIFRELVNQGKTLLMVTHDPEARRRADRSILLKDGSCEGESESLFPEAGV